MSEIDNFFTPLDGTDKRTNIPSTISSPVWSGGVATLTAFYTSSVQSGSSGNYYYDVYDKAGSDSTREVQFAVAYGHYDGSGSLSTSDGNNPSKAVYRQFRNIAIKRSNADWIVSTNLDVIPPTKQELKKLIKGLDKNTFYTISRREAPKDIIYSNKTENRLREALKTIPARHFPAKVTPNDNYSLINCCGDFQIAHRDVWNKIKGFEEEMIYACFVDTNVQKKAVLNGYNLEVLYEPALYHMEHGAYFTKADGTRVHDSENKGAYKGDNKAYNDAFIWVENFQSTKNMDNWGLRDVDIEVETI